MRWIFAIIFVWLSFVMSLAGWWLYFGITTLSKAASLGMPSQLAKHQKMLFTEGTVLLFCLLSGGLALFYLAYRMYKEKSAKEMFFASFAHDMKTNLFRLQLQVEKAAGENEDESWDKILGHTRKMQIDFENGLDSTIGQRKSTFIENINLKNLLMDLHIQWPEITIQFSGEEEIRSDRKALHSIFKNLFHNSFFHGEADQVKVTLRNENKNSQIIYEDNGKSFKGNLESLGYPQQETSQGNSGFGLIIVRQWVSKLGGKLNFSQSPSGSLKVHIQLPGGF